MGRFSIGILVGAFDEDFALAGVIGLADDAFLLHALHQRGGAIVADREPALDVAGRGLAVADHDLHRLLVEIAAFAAAHGGGVEDRIAVRVLRLLGGDGFEIFRRALRLEMPHDFLDFFVGHERPVHAADAAATCLIKYLALAEPLFGAVPSSNG